MPTVHKLISYSSFMYPNKGPQQARINLYCGDYKLYVIFTDTNTLPDNYYNAATKTGVAYAKFSQYGLMTDLVRNEGPISVTFNPDVTPPVYVVYAAQETPGEGEL